MTRRSHVTGHRSGAVGCPFFSVTKLHPFLQRWQSAWRTSCARCWACSRATLPPSTSHSPTWRRTSPACPCRRTTHWTSCAASRSRTCDSWSSASKASGWRQRRTPMMWRQTRDENCCRTKNQSWVYWVGVQREVQRCVRVFCSVVVWEWGAFWKRTNSDWNSIPELSGETSPNYPEWVDLAWMSCVISSLIPLTKHNSAWRLFYLFLAVTSSRPSSSVPSFYTLDNFPSSVTEVYFERLQTVRKCHALFSAQRTPTSIAESDHVFVCETLHPTACLTMMLMQSLA